MNTDEVKAQIITRVEALARQAGLEPTVDDKSVPGTTIFKAKGQTGTAKMTTEGESILIGRADESPTIYNTAGNLDEHAIAGAAYSIVAYILRTSL